MPKRIAIVVLGCVTAPYDEMIDAMRQTWGALRVPGVEVRYVYGNPHGPAGREVLARALGGETPPHVADDEIVRIGDVLIAGCADHYKDQEDSLLRKRLLAFGHLVEDEAIDLVYTICAASYVDQPALVEAAAGLRPTGLFYGPLGYSDESRTPFISGSSMLLSRDVARRLADDREEILEQNAFGWRDDVAFGHWVATRYSRAPVGDWLEFVENRRRFEPEQLFVRATHQTANFVLTPQQEQGLRPGVYHYHFDSRRPEHLRRLHWLWTMERRGRELEPA